MMEVQEEFYKTICRVCLTYNEKVPVVSLVDSVSEDGLSCYGKAVVTFTNIPIKNDRLPGCMCQDCLILLKQAIVFRKQCEKSHEILTSLMKKCSDLDSEIEQKVMEYVVCKANFPDGTTSKTSKITDVQILKFHYEIEWLDSEESEDTFHRDQAEQIHDKCYEDTTNKVDGLPIPITSEKQPKYNSVKMPTQTKQEVTPHLNSTDVRVKQLLHNLKNTIQLNVQMENGNIQTKSIIVSNKKCTKVDNEIQNVSDNSQKIIERNSRFEKISGKVSNKNTNTPHSHIKAQNDVKPEVEWLQCEESDGNLFESEDAFSNHPEEESHNIKSNEITAHKVDSLPDNSGKQPHKRPARKQKLKLQKRKLNTDVKVGSSLDNLEKPIKFDIQKEKGIIQTERNVTRKIYLQKIDVNGENVPDSSQKRTKLTTILKKVEIIDSSSELFKEYNCNICGKVFVDKRIYMNHIEQHGHSRFVCEHCGSGFPHRTRLIYHLGYVHKRGPLHQCKFCDFRIPEKHLLIYHERRHTGERPFTCDKCGKAYTRRSTLKKHSLVHKEEYNCNVCGKVFVNKRIYRNHIELHGRSRFVCEHCGSGFSQRALLIHHLGYVHKMGPLHQCKFCDFKIPEKYLLIHHERRHTGERPFTCDKCGKAYTRRSTLKKHSLVHKEKSFMCPKCPLKFYTKACVIRHYNNIHEGFTIFRCTECVATFDASGSFRKHLFQVHGIAIERQGKINKVDVRSIESSNKNTNTLIIPITAQSEVKLFETKDSFSSHQEEGTYKTKSTKITAHKVDNFPDNSGKQPDKRPAQKRKHKTDVKVGSSLDNFEKPIKFDIQKEVRNIQTERNITRKTHLDSSQKDRKFPRLRKIKIIDSNSDLFKEYNCNVCDKVFINKQTYINHIEQHVRLRFVCEHCGRGFPFKQRLLHHIGYIHRSGPLHQCKFCDYKSPVKYEVKLHERTHTGERPYSCDKCGITFHRTYTWKQHELYHNDKNVLCPKCPNKFYRRGDMLKHYNYVHERFRSYQCTECDVALASNGAIRRHLLKVHKIARNQQGKIKKVDIRPIPEARKNNSSSDELHGTMA